MEFQSATAPFAVCGFCRSTVVRAAVALSASARWRAVRRPQPAAADGQGRHAGRQKRPSPDRAPAIQGDSRTRAEWTPRRWSTGTLSEDNGSYVFTRPDEGTEPPPAQPLPAAGSSLRLGVTDWVVAYSGSAQLIAAEGELPKLPALGQPFKLLELRSDDGQVLSIDYGAAPPQVERGRAVELAHLQLKGLKDASVREHLAGAPSPALTAARRCMCNSTTPSAAPARSESLIDLTAGVGGAAGGQ